MHDLLPVDVVVEAGLALGAEFDLAFLQSEQGIVLADTDIPAGKHRSAALTDDDLARENALAMVDLDPKVFGIGISAVFGCSCRFLISHISEIEFSICSKYRQI